MSLKKIHTAVLSYFHVPKYCCILKHIKVQHLGIQVFSQFQNIAWQQQCVNCNFDTAAQCRCFIYLFILLFIYCQGCHCLACFAIAHSVLHRLINPKLTDIDNRIIQNKITIHSLQSGHFPLIGNQFHMFYFSTELKSSNGTRPYSEAVPLNYIACCMTRRGDSTVYACAWSHWQCSAISGRSETKCFWKTLFTT